MIKYFTIPGYGNSGDDHWQSYFESQLDNCTRINQKSWTEPLLTDWIQGIEEAIPKNELNDDPVFYDFFHCNCSFWNCMNC